MRIFWGQNDIFIENWIFILENSLFFGRIENVVVVG